MSKLHTIRLKHPTVHADKLGYFRYGHVAGQVLLTNDAGEWCFLEHADFELFLRGELPSEHPKHAVLVEQCIIREGADLDALSDRIRRKKSFVGVGPHLHVVVTTLRCNQTCRYCHASRTDPSRVETDMSVATAKKVVDFAMQSTSPYLNFEFQGGEPTYNMAVIKFVVEYAREKNKNEGKKIDFSLVTNFTLMTKENADWCIANDVWICTSLDGPEDIHNYNRLWKPGSNAYASVIEWIEYFNQAYIDAGRDPELWHVDALLTTTRKTLDNYKEVVDLYRSLGIRNIHLRPLNPYGFASASWKAIGYSIEEFLDFYAKALDYILELNLAGEELMEGTASTFLSKMLTPDDPNFVDIRSPCGAAVGQVAYNYDGKVYPCDEARMVAAMGDEQFAIATVDSSTIVEAIQHPTVKTIAIASLQDSLAGCDTCWNKPFCGVCPLHNFRSGGDLFGQRPNSPLCTQYLTISTLLMERLANDPDGAIERIFRRWTLRRERELSAPVG